MHRTSRDVLKLKLEARMQSYTRCLASKLETLERQRMRLL